MVPHTVTFTNMSTRSSSFLWDFGDGSTSTDSNPTYEYTVPGTYTVSLTATAGPQADTEVKSAYIRVLDAPPTADFSGAPTSGPAPLTSSFSDMSQGTVTSWFWSFGDGSTSTAQNPNHQYSSVGTYTVSLSVEGPGGVSATSKPSYVVVGDPAPTASFEVQPQSGSAPLSVQFTDQSSGAISGQQWSFGDGGTSTAGNGIHVYTSPGTYTVALTVTGPGGSDTSTQADYVVVSYPVPTADFTVSGESGIAPLTTSFTDASTGTITGWQWNFGDGAASTEQSPTHVYSLPGTYTVVLTVSGPGGSDADIQIGLVQVSDPAPVAAFTGSPLSGTAPLAVTYQSQSTGAITDQSWAFGDGQTSTAADPVHVYSSPGTYTVALTVLGPGGLDTLTRASYITVLEPAPTALFTGTPTGGVAPHAVQFTSYSTGNNLTYDWDFGDGQTATSTPSPSHTYATPGTYNVSLTVSNAGGLDTQSRAGYIRVEAPAPTSSFSAAPTAGIAPLTTSFTSLATGSITSYQWDFGDGQISSLANPTHAYATPGLYSVALTVIGPGGIDTSTQADLVNVSYPQPVADFIGSSPSGIAPHTVTFTDASSGAITSRTWLFGDGATSSDQNPVKTYGAPGTYTVSLMVAGPGGTDTEEKTDYVTVANPAPVSAFAATPTSGIAALTVQFQAQPTGGPVDTYQWSFGDGGTSTSANPNHEYLNPGTYSVTLEVNGPGGTSSETMFDLITVTNPAPIPQFTATPTSGITPLSVSFVDQSTGAIVGWSWDFGDGTQSTMQNPTHTYGATGTYTVSLTTIGRGGNATLVEENLITSLEPAPVADFFAFPITGVTPLTVDFTDTSSGNITSYAWDFGDGSTSSVASPSHTYAAEGQYTVSLTVTSAGGTSTRDRLNYVTVLPQAPVAEFTGTPTSGPSPLSVTFTDQSVGNITSWFWDFGDLTTSTVRHPSKVYLAPGNYTVTLTTEGPGGVGSEQKEGYVIVGNPPPTPGFKATPTSGIAPLAVSFTDTTTGVVTSWNWNFGDGATSTAQNPVKTYNNPGTYTVFLTATGPGGSNTLNRPDYITVIDPAPVASFSANPVSGVLPLSVDFFDASTGAISSYSWDFGDGASSSSPSPSHVYPLAGDYTVSLTVTGPGGSNTLTQTDLISVSEQAPVAGFTGTPLTGVAPLSVSFADASTGVITGHSWDFGDGGTSTQESPVYVYNAAGTYSVEQTVTGPGGSDILLRSDYVVVLPPPPVADFTSDAQSGIAPTLIQFTDASTGAVNSWQWSFGDGGTSSGQNPVHVYATPGTFTVSLTVTGPGGVDSETKTDYIKIELGLDDGSFENQVAGTPPGGVWTITGGLGHMIQPDSGVSTDGDLPTDGNRWADISADGTDAASGPSNPGGAGAPPSGAHGIAQSFTFLSPDTVLLFDAAFLCAEQPNSAAQNDFMSIDITDGSTHHNLYYADTFTATPNTSARYGLPMTDTTRVQVDLTSLYPGAGPDTILTLFVQVGNGGDSKNPSRGYADNFLLGSRGGATFVDGAGINPRIFSTRSVVLGSPWVADFDLQDFPSVTATLILTYSGSLPGAVTPFGELLVDLGSTNFFASVSLAGFPHTQIVPNNISVLGLGGRSQGFLLEGGANLSQFTNAAELEIGLVAPAQPVADFSATPVVGTAPLTVSFFDLSTGEIGSHFWDFGDGTTSTQASPVHTYVNPGSYSVTLVVEGPGGFDIKNRYDLIFIP